METLKSILLTTALLTGLALPIYSQAGNLERQRLKEQPNIGEIIEAIEENDYVYDCGENKVTAFTTSEGSLYFKADKELPPYIELNADGTIKQNPWAFYDPKGKNVYVNVNGDKTFDFRQSSEEHPCSVVKNLRNYVIKD